MVLYPKSNITSHHTTTKGSLLVICALFCMVGQLVEGTGRLRPEKRYLMNFRAPNFEDQLAALFENPSEPIFPPVSPSRMRPASAMNSEPSAPSAFSSDRRTNMCMNYITGDFFD